MVGMPGSGKTTVGRRLAQGMDMAFLDTDAEIERLEGKTVSEIFADQGEVYFRQREAEALQRACVENGVVVATGGGVVLNPGNVRLARESGLVVYLHRGIENIAAASDFAGRPLLAEDPGRLGTLFRERAGLYEAACHKAVDNDGDLNETVRRIMALLGESTTE